MVALDGSLLSKQASPSSAVEGTNGRACRHAALSADAARRMLIALVLIRLPLLQLPVPATVKLQAGTTDRFWADARMQRFAEKLSG